MHRIEIDRAKWGKYALLNANGTMCCMGFVCKQAGLTDAQMRRNDNKTVGYPATLWDGKLMDWHNLTIPVPEILEPLVSGAGYPTLLSNHLARINDSTDANREQQIIDIGREHGYEFVFVGEKA